MAPSLREIPSPMLNLLRLAQMTDRQDFRESADGRWPLRSAHHGCAGGRAADAGGV